MMRKQETGEHVGSTRINGGTSTTDRLARERTDEKMDTLSPVAVRVRFHFNIKPLCDVRSSCAHP